MVLLSINNADPTSTYVGWVEDGDELSSDALARVTVMLGADPAIDVLYTDYDHLDSSGRRTDAALLPGWSPERLLTHNYLRGLTVYRRSLLPTDPLNNHRRALVATDAATRIVHIPELLLHRRPHSNQECLVDLPSIQESLARRGVQGRAFARNDGTEPAMIAPSLTVEPTVSIIIPTIGSEKTLYGQRVMLARNAIQSILRSTDYSRFEIVVVVGDGANTDLPSELSGMDPRVRTIIDSTPFNFSIACNRGAEAATGDLLVFLNDDTEIISTDWLPRLVMWAMTPNIGAVGAKLLYSDERIQHAGIWARNGNTSHRYTGWRRQHRGYMESLVGPQNCMAVSGACLAVEHERFTAVGGFDPVFPLNFNDVDLCCKLREKGWRTVIDNDVELFHFESATREAVVTHVEQTEIEARWGKWLTNDVWDNPNHTAHGIEELPATSLAVLEMFEAQDFSKQPEPR